MRRARAKKRMTLLTKDDSTIDGREFAQRAFCDAEPAGQFIEFGVLTLDRYAHALTIAGIRMELSRMEFRLLEVLMRNAPRFVARDVLREKLWPGGFAGSNRLEVLVNQVRKKIGVSLIETVRRDGDGYRLTNSWKTA